MMNTGGTWQSWGARNQYTAGAAVPAPALIASAKNLRMQAGRMLNAGGINQVIPKRKPVDHWRARRCVAEIRAAQGHEAASATSTNTMLVAPNTVGRIMPSASSAKRGLL
jgi:hypothetical protein